MAIAEDWDTLLLQEPPREVPSTLRAIALRGERRWQVSLGVLALICSLTVAAFFPWAIADDIRLDLGGSTARGSVLESVYAKRTLGDDTILRKQLVFSTQFRFEDHQGREHIATSLFLGHVPPGTEVDVEFLPSNPTVARLKDGFFVPGGLWEAAWSAGFIALALLGLWNFRRWRRRRLTLLTHGVLVPGVIERVWLEHPQDDPRGWIALRYQADGDAVQLSETVEREIYRRACAIVDRATPVRVLYAERAPCEHIVVELTY